MRRTMQWVVAAALICGTNLFSGCYKEKDNDNNNNDVSLEEQMIGKWMLTQFEGHDLPTNAKMVYTFESTIRGYLSASRTNFTPDNLMWTDHIYADIAVNGNRISMKGFFDPVTSYDAEFNVKSYSETEMLADSRYTTYQNGVQMYTNHGLTLVTKVSTDYSQAILGLWEGNITSSESEFDDGQEHRWEYKDNGEYVYYSKVDNEWVPTDAIISEYFVDGTLLCTRWKNNDENQQENREWWEIESIKDGVMKWTALRQHEDGSSYIATFRMTKVQ